MTRPELSAAASLRCAFFAVAVLAALALGQPAGATVVLTDEGGILQVDRYRVEGDWAHLELAGGGLLILPVANIERVVDDRAAAPGRLERSPAGFELRFRAGDSVPDTRYGQLIHATARRHGMSPALVAAMVQAESAFDPKAVSPKGARGLLQLMPATARRFGVAPERLFEPGPNLDAGVRYLAWLARRFPGDLARILAAYNAGEAQVERHGGVPPFAETRDYIRRIYRLLAPGR